MIGDTEKRIIRELQRDGRRRLKSIAKELNIPLSTVYSKMKGLEKKKIIKSYQAIVDPQKLGLETTAFIQIDVSQREKVEDIAAMLNRNMYVEEIHLMASGFDILAKVRVKNTAKLGDLIFDKKKGLRSWPGIKKAECLIAFKSVKEYGPTPVV
ncbi:Lrp/AsnC family transcriptional regulator [Candidatus Undinarchaeota archaeon]